jgi:D-3-phosphoglycerate dehydrogenase
LDDHDEKKFKVLITEHVGQAGIDIFKEAPDVDLDIKIGLSREELHSILDQYDAVLTRSGTPMDKEAICAAKKLKVIARAGVGVDNVDLSEASRRGIVVINAPTGNTVAAAEQTIVLMLSVIRRTPQAYFSLRAGEWDRKRFMGKQLNGKKVLVIGVGRIGTQVAKRCRSFGMEILGYDPYVSEKKMKESGVKKVEDLADALSIADVVTVHVPNTKETRGMISEKMIRAITPGSYVINCARGGIIDEAACAEALRDGRLEGAAFDVFVQEPPSKDDPLLAEDIAHKIVLTPHLGANTFEAQSEVARIAATNALAALRGEEYGHAVNLPFMMRDLNYKQKNFIRLARKMGFFAAKMLETDGGAISRCKVMIRGPFLNDEDIPGNKLRPYTVAVLKGLLEVSHGHDANYMIAPILAQERGIAVEESTGEAKTYRNSFEIEVEGQNSSISLIGTITEEGRQHIVKINDYWIDFVPHGKLLVFQNHDRPGVIGKIGNYLGNSSVNIANFTLGRKNTSGLALAVMEVDGVISDELTATIEKDTDMLWALTVDFDEENESCDSSS